MENRIDKAYRLAPKLDFDDNAKFVFLSDCHRGTGGWGDNLQPNQTSYMAALSFYYRSGFTYAELGDGDEMWENRRFSEIATVHQNIFSVLTKFFNENRLIMLHGNHDIDKKRKPGLLDSYTDFMDTCPKPLFPGLHICESVVLRYVRGGHEVLLLHGHQGDLLNDTFWMLSRFLVRYLWRPLEGVGFKPPTRGAPSANAHSKSDALMTQWCEKNGKMIIAGHTHHAAFPVPGDSLYLNDGSCVQPYGITAIELSDGNLTLVKWAPATRVNGSLFIGRDILAGPYAITDYFTGHAEGFRSVLCVDDKSLV